MSNTGSKKITKGRITSLAEGVKYAIDTLGGASVASIFRTILIVFNIMIIIFLYNVVTSQQTVEKIIDNAIEVVTSNQEQQIDLDIRDQVSPQISSNLRKLLYTLDADRSFVIELHNGKKNATALPFKYFDMTYEEIHDERAIPYVSQDFMNLMISHYRMPFYLVENQIFMGDTEDVRDIDPRLAKGIEKFNGKYLALIILRSNGQNIGFVGVSYSVTHNIPNENIIRTKLHYYSRILAPLLDLRVQKNKLNIKDK